MKSPFFFFRFPFPLFLGAGGLLASWFPAVAQLPPERLPFSPVRIISPVDRSVFPSAADISLYAYARNWAGYSYLTNFAGGPITNVAFFTNDTKLGNGVKLGRLGPPGGPYLAMEDEYALVWTNAPPGVYALTVRAMSTSGRGLTSAPVNITVTGPDNGSTNRPDVISVTATTPVAIVGTNCWIWYGLTNGTPSWTNWCGSHLQAFTNCGPQNGVFTVRRFGDVSEALAVAYTLGGTASNSVDYATLPGVVELRAGQNYAQINVVPIDTSTSNQVKSVILVLSRPQSTNAGYGLGQPAGAAVALVGSDRLHPPTGLLPGRMFHLAANGPDGAWFSIEASSDLKSWLPICTNQVVHGAIDFVDPAGATDSGRIYRVVPQIGLPQ